MDDKLDPFVGVPQQTEYYQEGTMFPSGFLGECASKVHQLGMLCLKPLEKGLFFSFKSLHMDPLSLGGLSLKAQKTLYFVASVAFVALGLPFAFLGKGFCLSVSAFKKDFVWQQLQEEVAQGRSKEDFHLLTLNMAGVPDWLAERNYLKPINERVHSVTDSLERYCGEQMPDVICFQEMFDEEASKKLLEDLRQKGYMSFITDVGTSSRYLNSGLFLASKYPLSDVVFYPHPIKQGIEQYADKGLLIVTVHANDKCVIVGNTHLNGGAEGGGYLPRAAQLKAIDAHMDRYIHDRCKEGKKIHGAFLSADTNVAPLDVDHGKTIFEFEWYLQQLILNPKKAQTYLQQLKLNVEQTKALESLKILEKVLPAKDNITDPSAWKEFFFHVKKIQEANFFEVNEDLETFLTQMMPKQLGGPMLVEKWHHDVDSLEKALAGSAVEMESSWIYKKLIIEPKRLDYNFTRSKKDLESEKLFQSAHHLSTQVLPIAELSDHLPVYSHFRL